MRAALRLEPPRTRGQSTTEFAVLALVLAPLFVLVPLLGKYLDLSRAATVASRYAAFEIAISGPAAGKDDVTLAAEARRRFFGTSEAPIKTGDVAGDSARYRNPLWLDHRGDSLLAKLAQDVTVNTAARSRTVLPPALAPFVGSLNLLNENFRVATVTVLPAVPARIAQWSGMQIEMKRPTAILTNSWNAHSAAAVKGTIEGANQLVLPDAALRMEALLFGWLPALFLDPAMPPRRRHDPDVVPCDRLVPRC